MKILWLSHPTQPELNGTEEHVSRTVAEIAIGFRQAKFVPYKSYVERLNAEAREGSHSGNTVVPAPVVGTEYALGSMVGGAPCIIRKSGTETARITTVELAKACKVPAQYVEQLRRALDMPKAAQLAASADRAKINAEMEAQRVRELNERF